jgi:hypothetical protein
MPEPSRRFPSSWRADTMGGYVVRDANGQALASCTRERTKTKRGKVLTGDEARRIAVNIARLPELLGKGGSRLIRSSGFVRTNVMLVAELPAGRADALRIKGSEQGPRRGGRSFLRPNIILRALCRRYCAARQRRAL